MTQPRQRDHLMQSHFFLAQASAAVERLLDQDDPDRLSVDPTTRHLRRLCGQWIALRRQQLELTEDEVAERTRVDAEQLFLLETGLADETAISEEAQGQLSKMLAGQEYNAEWANALISVAIGRDDIPNNDVVDRLFTALQQPDDEKEEDM